MEVYSTKPPVWKTVAKKARGTRRARGGASAANAEESEVFMSNKTLTHLRAEAKAGGMDLVEISGLGNLCNYRAVAHWVRDCDGPALKHHFKVTALFE